MVVGGVALASQLLDGSGTLDLPSPSPRRWSSARQRPGEPAAPAGFNCASAGRTMNFTIDPVDHPGDQRLGWAGGFPTSPGPHSDVPGGLRRPERHQAVGGRPDVAGLQRISTTMLHPTVRALSTATGNNAPLLLVATSSEIPSSIVPPLSGRARRPSRSTTPPRAILHGVEGRLAAGVRPDLEQPDRGPGHDDGDVGLSDSLFPALGDTLDLGNLAGDVAAVGPAATWSTSRSTPGTPESRPPPGATRSSTRPSPPW